MQLGRMTARSESLLCILQNAYIVYTILHGVLIPMTSHIICIYQAADLNLAVIKSTHATAVGVNPVNMPRCHF